MLSRSAAAPATSLVPGRRARRVERRRLHRYDVLAARLAELHLLAPLLVEAASVVEGGWVRHGWFGYLDEEGRTHVVSALDVRRMVGRPVVAACLVGAVVHAGGGPAAVRTQPVSHALDLTWSVLRHGGPPPVPRTPSPAERAVEVLDLTGWNDAPERRAHDVVALLRASADAARVEAGRVRAEAAAL